jgi:hypothetical protein
MILQKMTLYAREIEDIVSPKSSISVEAMSKGTRYIILLYHQVNIIKQHSFQLGTNSDMSTLWAVRGGSDTASFAFCPQGTTGMAGTSAR